MSRLYNIVDDMHKEANLLSQAGKFIAQTPGVGVGGAAGGLYGAYKGSQGEDGGLKGALVGGLQGAAGGALIGGAANKLYSGIKGGAISDYLDARKKVGIDAGLAKNERGFFSRTFGKGKKKIDALHDSTAATKVKDKVRTIMDQEQSGLLSAADARSQIDALNKSTAITNLGATRDKLIFGTIGAGVAANMGKGIISAGAKAGEGTTDQQRMQNLRAKYQQTGKLDPREMHMLTSMLNKRQGGAQGSSAV